MQGARVLLVQGVFKAQGQAHCTTRVCDLASDQDACKVSNRPTDDALGTLKHWYHDGCRETVVSNGDAQPFHVGTFIGYLGGDGDLVVNGGGEASVVDGEDGGCGVGAHGVSPLLVGVSLTTPILRAWQVYTIDNMQQHTTHTNAYAISCASQQRRASCVCTCAE